MRVKPGYKNVESQRYYREYIEMLSHLESWDDVNPLKLAGSYGVQLLWTQRARAAGANGCN